MREAVEELIEETEEETESSGPASERVLLNNVLHLHDRRTGDCMVPRADIIAVDAETTMEDLITLMVGHAHSRIPVYRETLDNMVGMVHMKDVLVCLARRQQPPLRELLRPVLFTVPSMPISRLLSQMRTTRQHMAMVVDEFGGVDGLVTIEDLVEEIVGEIEDEHDLHATPSVLTGPDGALVVDARLPLEVFETHMGPVLTDEDRATFDTLGGYVLHLAGGLPSVGATIQGPGDIAFDVLDVDPTRIVRLRVRRPLPEGV